VEVRAPRANEHGKRRCFERVILPSFMRPSPKVCEVPPLLYLQRLTSVYIVRHWRVFATVAGLSAATFASAERAEEKDTA
jgi:hypothetical protein